jgi:hypothetical protein
MQDFFFLQILFLFFPPTIYYDDSILWRKKGLLANFYFYFYSYLLHLFLGESAR